VAVVALATVLAGTAHAHDPLFLTEEQREAVDGPLLPDARISFALYGTLLEPGQQRGFRFRIPAGEPIDLALLIPDLAPENDLATSELPILHLRRPDGTTQAFDAAMAETFAEPFTRTNYVRLAEHQEPGTEGTYEVLVIGAAAARFTVSIGFIERFGTPVEGAVDRAAGVGGVARWYESPPPNPADIAPDNPATSTPTTTPDNPATSTPTTTPEGSGTERGSPTNTPVIIGGLLAPIVLVLLLRRLQRGSATTEPDSGGPKGPMPMP